MNTNATKTALFVAVLMVSLAAYAATREGNIDRRGTTNPQLFESGVYISLPDAGGEKSTNNKILNFIGCPLFDYDFPPVLDHAELQALDKYAGAVPCPGLQIGAACEVSVLAATPADGGSASIEFALYKAVAAAKNVARLSVFNHAGDAGPLNAPDAGYLINCIQRAY